LLFADLSLPLKLQPRDTEAFKPSGKPEARIFTTMSSTFADGESHTKFDIGRAYFGYNYNFSRSLSGRVVYDVADPGAGKLKFTGMLKFAYLRYQTDKLTVTGGMIPLPEYDQGDRKWGYRYVYKPFHDEYGFGTAADLGLSAAYNIASWISADVTLVNGEGYKLVETDSTFKAAAGITLIPVKGFYLRSYFDNMTKNSINQQTLEIIAGYDYKLFSLSAAYNFRKNQSMIGGRNYQGFTVNATAFVSKKIKLYGRYDYLTSVIMGSDPDPWNIAKDGQLIIAGAEFALSPGVNISPNFQGWNPAGSGLPFLTRFSISLDLKI